jgi:hypothetical protein
LPFIMFMPITTKTAPASSRAFDFIFRFVSPGGASNGE